MKRYLIKLKTILHYRKFYYVLFFLVLIYVIYNNFFVIYESKYTGLEKEIIGTVEEYNVEGDFLNIEIRGLENIQGNYYFKNLKEKNEFIKKIKLGYRLKIGGTLNAPTNNTNPNLFNYRNYLYYNHMFYIIDIDRIEFLDNNTNLLYKIKNFINKRISKIKKSDNYVRTFILGNNKDIDKEVREGYQSIGVSHLFAVSGMHVSLLSAVIIFILKRFNINYAVTYIVVVLFLCLYMFLTGFSPSIVRASTFFFCLSLNKFFKLEVSIINVFVISIFIILIVDPLIIHSIGFLFSTIISMYLIIFSSLISDRKNYITKLFMTSFISLLVSMPIVIYNFYSINYLSVIYNLLFVPLISFCIFPLSLLTFIFLPLDNILYKFINCLEKLSLFFNSLNTNITLVKPNMMICFIYYIFVTVILLLLRKNKRIYIFLLILVLLIYSNYNVFSKQTYILMFDVGQGDSILLHSYNKNILIDTGGKVLFEKKEKWRYRKNKTNLVDNTLIPVFKSFGIGKLDYLILSHGDFDHMGEAINLVNNFKVEKVIFNCGEFNDLEKELIKVLDKKHIKYYSCIKELNIDKNKLYFLQTKEYDNENDNSNVIYTELNGYRFMFMGDAGVDKEKDILDKYNINDIDVLKVGHHGSKTSSGKEFIDEIKPKYSIISVGKNNRYGHPNKEVLENLKISKIYRTDEDGSIMFKIRDNKLQVETCAP